MRATYSPEDNKLRIYPSGVRVDSILDETEYAEFKKAGYKWASKQECFVAARWTPAAEDWALELADEIEDEDYSPEERSADRAERFEGYLDKRRDEAHGHADNFAAGPDAFGHQNRQRAERQARRHDRHRGRALNQWGKAEYWQQRTEGVISHALHKSSAPVRRGRILTLEADQRKFLANVEACQKRYDAWCQIRKMEGSDQLLPLNEDGYALVGEMNPAQKMAYLIANDGHSWVHLWHPTCEEANAECKRISTYSGGFSMYDLLTRTEYIGKPFTRLAPRQLAALYVDKIKNPSDQESFIRWKAHYELRLAYENSMLENEGGKAADVEMEPGGWIGGRQIIKVNKSPVTGRVVSVQVMGTRRGYTKESGYTKEETRPTPVTVNIERCGADVYRAPTDEEREQFKEQKKASKKPPVSTINPTDEDAQRFQMLLNQRAAKHAIEKGKGPSKDREIELTTQAKFSRYSCDGSIYQISQFTIVGATFKVRIRHRGFYDYNAADSVLILTDKPQKPIPIDWEKAFDEVEPKPLTSAAG